MTASVVQGPDISAETVAARPDVVTLLDVAGAGGRLVRRLAQLPPGTSRVGTAGPAGELWFVISGTAVLETTGLETTVPETAPGPEGLAGAGRAGAGRAGAGRAGAGGAGAGGAGAGGAGAAGAGVAVGAEHGVWLPPGTGYRLRAGAAQAGRPGGVLIDIVALPGTRADGGFPAPLVSDLRDCPAEVTGDRRFRVLFGPGSGCPEATQFVGEIPPGRAPAHTHAYDEAVLVLAGAGVVHLGAGQHPLRPGTCVHLPPGQPHCLENTGTGTLRVLGVFHPGGSPAAKQPAG